MLRSSAFPLIIDVFELRSKLGGVLLSREQALDPDLHIGDTAGGIDPGRKREAEVADRDLGNIARVLIRKCVKRSESRASRAAPEPLQPLRHKNAVIAVERYNIRHGPERDKVKEPGELRLLSGREGAAGPKLRAERDQNVEDHADTGEVPRRSGAVRSVRIHDAGRGREVFAPGDGDLSRSRGYRAGLRAPRLFPRFPCRYPR